MMLLQTFIIIIYFIWSTPFLYSLNNYVYWGKKSIFVKVGTYKT